MNEYYTYALIDPRTEQPFYIGKGKGRRCEAHSCDYMLARNTLKSAKIKSLQSLGLEYSIVISDNLSEEDAFAIERMLVNDYGRVDIGTGILTNHTDGGEGSSGSMHTKEAKSKISKSMTGRSVSDENKERLKKELTNRPLILREGAVDKVTGDNHWSAKLGDKVHPLVGSKMSEERLKKHIEASPRGENHHRYGYVYSDEEKARLSASMVGIKKKNTDNMKWERKRIECPHCGKEGIVSNMKRWHFDNCKELADV